MSERLNHNPDVLSCLANLSNDEVLTPPEVANAMLDMLPQELFRDPNARFLDPACKSGIFLREIAKRLLDGLKDSIPDRQERIDHIFHKQLYGIAITELTSLLARRSLYCSKHASSVYSVTPFEVAEGNIRFKRIEHTWDSNGKCQYCGASKEQFDRGIELETHAYEFIHIKSVKELNDMKFDLIISNPPYQLSDGGNAASAMPIYQKFVVQSKKLKPRFLSMIIPARWYTGGRGLDGFRDMMLHDERIRVIHDYPSSSDCFPGVEIKGGICYFKWDRDNKGLCEVYTHNNNIVTLTKRPLLEPGMATFIRNDIQISVLKKVLSFKEQSFSSWVNAGRYFGFHTKVEWIEKNDKGKIQTADGKSFIEMSSRKTQQQGIKVYIHGGECWVGKQDIPKNVEGLSSYKVLLPRSGSPGSTIIGKPKLSEPESCSSNTYAVVIRESKAFSKEEAENIISYITTKFFRFLVAIKTSTQDIAPKAYEFVPIQDFSKTWTDNELYLKYDLVKEEIDFIESMIRPMDVGGSDE